MEFNRLFEKRSINLLFLIHSRKKIHSSELMITGANYSMVHERALELQEKGMIISSPDDHRGNRINWELTSRGNAVVLLLTMATRIADGKMDYKDVFPHYVIDYINDGQLEKAIRDLFETNSKR